MTGVTSRGDETAARVAGAMRAVRREMFLPAGQRRDASHDRPLPLWAGQTNSQPSTVAAMLELLDVPPGARVLDVGAGSGWTTALLAHLTGPAGEVLGLEILPDLAEWGAANVRASEMPWARVEAADPAVLGRIEEGPYDRILVSAMATDLPATLVDQLAPGGILVAPVAGRMLRVARAADAPAPGGASSRTDSAPAIEVTRHGHYRFVPLIVPPSR